MDFNTILNAGILITLFGALVAYLRSIPPMIYRKIRSYFLFTIEIHQNDSAFRWFMLWLNNHPSTEKSKNLAVSTETEDGVTKVFFTPLGVHFFKYKGNYIWFNRSREKQNNNGAFMALYETLTITTLAKKRGFLEQLVNEVREFEESFNKDKIIIHTSRYDYWTQLSRKNPRSIDTVILPEVTIENTLEDVKTFLNTEDWYKRRGVPYRRGYLLWGPPGNGKSSLVFAIASELRRNIAIINLADPQTSDNSLLSILADTPERSILLIEDIDTIFEGRETKVRDSKLTFSGLLNAIDGVAASDGRILFMTTNHKDALDPALIRPGRADKQVSIDSPCEELREKMYLRFFPDESENAATFATDTPDGTSAATIQEILMAKNGEDIV